jgi:DnaJ-class molecular chaperone
MAKVYNQSRRIFEKAKEAKCPRCKGFGGVFPDDDQDNCYLCKGYGFLWMAESGWTRAKYSRESNLY